MKLEEMREALWGVDTEDPEYADRIDAVIGALTEMIDAEAKRSEVIEIPNVDTYLREKMGIDILEIKRQAKLVISQKAGYIHCVGMLDCSIEFGIHELQGQGWVCSASENQGEVEIIIDFTQSLRKAQERLNAS